MCDGSCFGPAGGWWLPFLSSHGIGSGSLPPFAVIGFWSELSRLPDRGISGTAAITAAFNMSLRLHIGQRLVIVPMVTSRREFVSDGDIAIEGPASPPRADLAGQCLGRIVHLFGRHAPKPALSGNLPNLELACRDQGFFSGGRSSFWVFDWFWRSCSCFCCSCFCSSACFCCNCCVCC